jgi:hypothetical protein
MEYECIEEVGAWILGFTNYAMPIIDPTYGYKRATQEAEERWLDVCAAVPIATYMGHVDLAKLHPFSCLRRGAGAEDGLRR